MTRRLPLTPVSRYGRLLCIFSLLTAGGLQAKPRLVVGITIDQMRWDYLYRYEHRWHENGGFRRLLQQGYHCENTYINYQPSYTGCGHASIFTGTVPAYHGITGNSWWDHDRRGYLYCVSDSNVRTVGAPGDAGHMSPANLLTTTIADELRMATNFRGKTIGIALKDRGGILAVGGSANAAYWYDGQAGAWVSSTFYMQELPGWVRQFATRKVVDSLYRLNWDLLYPKETYTQSLANRRAYEIRAFGSPERAFPYNLQSYAGNDYSLIISTPHGNTLTTAFAKAAIAGEQLGADSIPDLLAVSYSSTDYIGHAFGPNSAEMEDTFLRLDLELGEFFRYLDQQVGAGNYLVFISADHGAAHVPGFMKEFRMRAGWVDERRMLAQLNAELKKQFGINDLVRAILNAQVVLQREALERYRKVREDDILAFITGWLEQQPEVMRAFRLDALGAATLPEDMKQQIANGYLPQRCGQIQMIYKPGFVEGFLNGGTTHGTGYAYDTHIPLIWYGWNIAPGRLLRRTHITDIAPTVAALLRIQEPSGSIGHAIPEVVKNRP